MACDGDIATDECYASMTRVTVTGSMLTCTGG
jgi:hypothetical protein